MRQANKKEFRLYRDIIDGKMVTRQSGDDEASLSFSNDYRLGLCTPNATKESVLDSIILRLDGSKEFYPMIQHSDLIDDEGNFKSESDLPNTKLGAMLFDNLTPRELRHPCWEITLGKLREIKDLWMSTYAKDYD